MYGNVKETELCVVYNLVRKKARNAEEYSTIYNKMYYWYTGQGRRVKLSRNRPVAPRILIIPPTMQFASEFYD